MGTVIDSCAVRMQLMLDGSFAVSRRTWIDTEGSRWTKRPWSVGLDADNISLLIGTCLFLCQFLFKHPFLEVV